MPRKSKWPRSPACPRQSATPLRQTKSSVILSESPDILRVCDFFDVVKNRGCKQNSYDDKLVINSKKSQTLSGVESSLRELSAESKDPQSYNAAAAGFHEWPEVGSKPMITGAGSLIGIFRRRACFAKRSSHS